MRWKDAQENWASTVLDGGCCEVLQSSSLAFAHTEWGKLQVLSA